jgi:ActR/RegA family two-component response regulator
MTSVLVIDDDQSTVATFTCMLRLAGFEASGVTDGREGLNLAVRSNPDVAIVDLNLGDMSGLDVIRELKQRQSPTHCIVMSGYASIDTAVKAMRLGADDVVEKPLSDSDLVDVVNRVLSCGAARASASGLLPVPEAHAAARWADAVVRALDSPRDPKTLAAWARHIGVSYGALRNWCSTAQSSPKRSLSFTRVLRAVARKGSDSATRPADLLDIVDRRTLKKLLRLGSVTRRQSETLPLDVDEFLREQNWIDSDQALARVRALVMNRYG